jgi:hypothetical protein
MVTAVTHEMTFGAGQKSGKQETFACEYSDSG